jgi:hypothetical protein
METDNSTTPIGDITIKHPESGGISHSTLPSIWSKCRQLQAINAGLYHQNNTAIEKEFDASASY